MINDTFRGESRPNCRRDPSLSRGRTPDNPSFGRFPSGFTLSVQVRGVLSSPGSYQVRDTWL